nr:FliH/SctL family protein [uncultured Roseateles sp.]
MNAARTPRQVPPPLNADGQPRATTYGRFIPREEVQNATAWTPGSFQDRRAPSPPPAAAAKPETPKLDPAQQLHAARQGGYQDGYRDGMAALDAFKHTFAQQMTSQIGALLRSFDSDLQRLEQAMATALAQSAVELARQVVRSEITQRPEHVVQVAREAVEALLLSARHVRVRVHPADMPLVNEGAGADLHARGAQLLGDPSIERGGCLVESDISVIDARISSRWKRAAAAMGDDSDWSMTETPAPAADPEDDQP